MAFMKVVIGVLSAVLMGMGFLILNEQKAAKEQVMHEREAQEAYDESLRKSTREIELFKEWTNQFGYARASEMMEEMKEENRKKRMLELQEEQVRLLREK